MALAERLFNAALQDNPDHAGALKLLGDVYFKEGKNNLAWESYRSLLYGNGRFKTSAESDPRVLAAYGETSFAKGDMAEAKLAFEDAVQHGRDFLDRGLPTVRLKTADINSLRAQAMMAAAAEAFLRSQGEDAETWTRKALAVRPRWDEAQFYLGYFMMHALPHRPDQAESEFAKLAYSSNGLIRNLVSKETSGMKVPPQVSPSK